MKQNKKFLWLHIGLGMLILLVISLWLNRVQVNSHQSYAVNEMRLEYNELYQMLLSTGVSSTANYQPIYEYALDREIHVIVSDLSSKVIFSNHAQYPGGSSIHLMEMLYMDHAYDQVGEEYHKLSFPVIDSDDNVLGFLTIEAPVRASDNQSLIITEGWVIGLILLALLWLYTFLKLFKQEDTLQDLKDGLHDLSKGKLKPIAVTSASDYKDLYVSYNLVVEELGFIMKKQQLQLGEKKAFLTKISHELKTPVATINAYVEGLISGLAKDDETRERYQCVIYEKMQQLMRQIEDFFRYAQEEGGQLKYNFQECYADELFGKIFNALQHSDLYPVMINNRLPKTITLVDPVRIEQVVMNLYNNAMKHSKNNNPIEITAYRQENELHIELKDSGEGIDPRDMPYIFDYYYQGSKSRKTDYEGIGLGLAICKEIMDKHQGRIMVKSQMNKGTTMTMILPVV